VGGLAGAGARGSPGSRCPPTGTRARPGRRYAARGGNAQPHRDGRWTPPLITRRAECTMAGAELAAYHRRPHWTVRAVLIVEELKETRPDTRMCPTLERARTGLEGQKTMGLEMVEQLGWRGARRDPLPEPAAGVGPDRPSTRRSRSLRELGLDRRPAARRLVSVQASGCRADRQSLRGQGIPCEGPWPGPAHRRVLDSPFPKPAR